LFSLCDHLCIFIYNNGVKGGGRGGVGGVWVGGFGPAFFCWALNRGRGSRIWPQICGWVHFEVL